MPTPWRSARYSGSERPACRMYQTGVCGTGSPRAALMKALSREVRRRVRHRRIVPGQSACSHIGTGRPTYCWHHGGPSGDPPGNGCGLEPPGVPGGCGHHARGAAAARGVLRGDARAAADRAVRRGADRRRDRRRHRPRHRPHHPAPRPRRQRRLGRHLPLRRLRPRRDRARPGHRPDARRRRLVVADRGPRRPRGGVHRRLRHRDPRGHRELRRDGRRGRLGPARAARLVDPARRLGPRAPSSASTASTSAPTWRPGASCSARPSVSNPSPRASPRSPADEGNAAPAVSLQAMPSAEDLPPEDTPVAPDAPLLELRDGLPKIVDTAAGLAGGVRGHRRRHRPGGHRRRAGLGLPLLRPRLPHPAAPRRAPAPSWSTRSPSTRWPRCRRPSRAPSGSCTPRPRTCPA